MSLWVITPSGHAVARFRLGPRGELAVRRQPRSKRSQSGKSSQSSIRQIIEDSTELLERGAHSKALKILSSAVSQYPSDAAVLARYGDALCQAGEISAARDAYRGALVLDESVFQAWYGRGVAELSFKAFADAIACFRRASALEPRDADVRFYLGKALFGMGDVDAAIKELSRAAKSSRIRRQALRQIAVIIPGSPSRRNRAILEARRKWARAEEKIERPGRARKVRRASSSEKLRVGYVSSFFQDRNWMKPVWGVINHHDRSAFEIHLFADEGAPSSESGYKPNRSDSIHSITGLPNETVAKRISKAGIDVLVDLNGYSSPARLGIFMRRPAPVMVGWFNAYATSGIRAFDHIIGDAEVIPPAEERFYSERVLRVAGSYLAFSVLYPVPDVAPPPCVRNGYVTFGCLAPQYKITPEVIAAWVQILRGAPTARLLLKSSCLHDAANRAAVLAKFSQKGIAPERVILEGPEEHYAFLGAYTRVDVALDTFPYNGGTTTMEALWQGVPVLTFSGDRWVGRISRSILAAAGLRDWVEASVGDYIRRAIDLAVSRGTSGRLARLRHQMRDRLLGSAACDSAGLCRELERHYRSLANGEQG